MTLNRSYILLLVGLLLHSCMDDDQWYNLNDYNEQSTGVFILNEGNFMYDNASLSFYKPDSLIVQNNVFAEANGAPLGDVAQSMTIKDSLGFIVLNNSGKIYVINTNTFEFAGKITGLTSPRYIHFINDSKAYVTDLYSKTISIVNPLTFEVTGTIDVDNNHPDFAQHATEQMLQHGKYLFVNCWSYDDKLLVINTETDQWIDSIAVPIQPRSMVMDKNENIWVLTDGGFAGNPFGHEEPALLQLDPQTRQIVSMQRFDLSTSPSDLAINNTGDTLYFINGNVYRRSIYENSTTELFIESPYDGAYDRGFAAIGVDPRNGDIYVADAIDNIQRGAVYRHQIDGTAIDTFRVGIIPTAFIFK